MYAYQWLEFKSRREEVKFVSSKKPQEELVVPSRAFHNCFSTSSYRFFQATSLNAKTTCELRRRYDDFCTVNLTRTTDRPFSFLLFRVRRRDAPFSLPFGRGRSGLNCEATANESDHKSKARPDHGPRPREREQVCTVKAEGIFRQVYLQ